MITVIIPTLNEEEQIADVINFVKRQPNVTEVIVVDDKSLDNTVSIAQENGAKVIPSTKLGKGASMKDGVLYASNEIIVFLDGGVFPYPADTISLLTDKITSGEIEFIKASFNNETDRVTDLVAKPLLSIFFPDLLVFHQPLCGIIAGKKKLFEQIEFSEDYGVDIGILIDMHLKKVRMEQVEINFVKNKIKPLKTLGKISKEVAQTIIQKASLSKNPNFNFEEFGVLNEIRSQMEFAINNQLKGFDKLIVFEIENILLRGGFINACASEFGFEKELLHLRASEKDPIILTKRIANLLKGQDIGRLIEITESILITEGIKEVVSELKRRGYIVGIISDNYDIISLYIKNKLGMDFSLSNELEFSKSICTGEVKLPSFFFNNANSICKHSICKTNALLNLLNEYKIKIENCIIIGESVSELCMIKEAGLGISFGSNYEIVKLFADVEISKPSFQEILNYAK